MRLVRLTDGVSVNPEFVVEVRTNWDYNSLTVRMADGKEHHLQPDFASHLGQTRDRIMRELETER